VIARAGLSAAMPRRRRVAWTFCRDVWVSFVDYRVGRTGAAPKGHRWRQAQMALNIINRYANTNRCTRNGVNVFIIPHSSSTVISTLSCSTWARTIPSHTRTVAGRGQTTAAYKLPLAGDDRTCRNLLPARSSAASRLLQLVTTADKDMPEFKR